MSALPPGSIRRAVTATLLWGLLALVALGPFFDARPAGAAEAEPGARPRASRVLVISVPYLTWSDLGLGSTPVLDRLLDQSAVANLSARAARRRTPAGDGYATIGAGTRAGAPRSGDGLALAPTEEFEGGTAADAYQRRYGRSLEGAAAAMLSESAYDSVNRRLLFGGEVGALGDALVEAGVAAAAIGNADSSRTSDDYATYSRQVAASLMTTAGVLPAGRVDRGLLEKDNAAPYGHRLDQDKVVAAFEAVWDGPEQQKVVVVEASDLARATSYGESVAPDQKPVMLRYGKRVTDRLVGSLLERVDERHDAVLVVSPATPPGPTRLTVVGLRAPGMAPGLLRSAYTRRSGSLAIVDIGPTILDLLRVHRPVSMEGRPAEWGRGGGSAADRRSELVETERDARFRDKLVAPVALGFVVVDVVLAGAAFLVLRLNRRGLARSALEVAALSLLGFLPATYLSALLPFAEWGQGAYFAFVILGGLAVGLAAHAFLKRGRDLLPVALVLALIVLVISGSAVTGSSLNLNTVFGDSPIVAGRFTGINNLTFSQLITAVLILAGFISHRYRGTPGALAAVAVLAGALVIDGMPIWGADIGGVLAAVPAFAIVGGLLLGIRVGPRVVATSFGGTAVAMTGFTLFDLSRPPAQRSHLGRLFEQVDGEGWSAFSTVVERKLNANLSVLTSSPWTLMVPAALAFVAYLFYRSPSALGEIQRRVPQLRYALTGMGVAGALGFALNDSGIAVPGMMLGVLNPVLVYLSARWT